MKKPPKKFIHGQQKLNFFVKEFPRANRLLTATFGQRGVECSGIALAALKFYLQGQFAAIDIQTEQIAQALHVEGDRLYNVGITNHPEEVEGNGHIDIASIYDSRENFENVINISPTARIVLQTSFTAMHSFDGVTIYLEGLASNNFKQSFDNAGGRLWTNFAVCKRGNVGGHYISGVLLPNGQWMVIDGLGRYKFHLCDNIDSMLDDITEFTRNCAFNVFSARLEGIIQQGLSKYYFMSSKFANPCP